MEDLNTSLDSLELEIYHRPNRKIHNILCYLRGLELQFCTDPKKKQNSYKAKTTSDKELGLSNNRFFKKRRDS